ncbi:hypothetical protein ACLOJK_029847 [Asimina triloba]
MGKARTTILTVETHLTAGVELGKMGNEKTVDPAVLLLSSPSPVFSSAATTESSRVELSRDIRTLLVPVLISWR